MTTITGTPSRGVMLGVNPSLTATFNLSGTGTLTVAGTSRLMIGRTDASAANTTNLFSQTGGAATISDMTMGGPNAAAGSNNNATLTLTGGTFTATAFSLLSAAQNDVSTINIGGTAVVTLPNLPTARGSGATATINFDGGTLRNSAPGTFITGLNNAFIEDGGAQFDTSLNSTTISQNLLTHGSSLGGGLTKIGANTLTLTGANTYTGPTTVSVGTLQLGVADNRLPTGTALTVLSAGIFDLAGFNQAIASLAGVSTTAKVTNSAAVTRTLTSDQTSTTTYAGAIEDSGGSSFTAFTVNGTGVTSLTLSGTNTYRGVTTVGSGGKLAVSGSLSGTTAVNVNNGGTLLLNASAANNPLNTGAAVTVGGGTSGTLSMQGVSASTGTSAGTLTLSANSTLDFGTGDSNTLRFDSLIASGAGITITRWTGTAYTSLATDSGTPATQDRLLITTGLTPGQSFGNISFYGDDGITFLGTGEAISFTGAGGGFEIVPVPEPATTALIGAVALCALIGYRERRRFSRKSGANSAA